MVFSLFRSSPSDIDYPALNGLHKWAFSWMPQSSIAVGVGSLSSIFYSAIARKAAHTFAVRRDTATLQQLKNDNVPVYPIEASESRLPFPSDSIDTMFLLNVLEYARSEVPIINEVQRVLRPGGNLILAVRFKGLFRFLKLHGVTPDSSAGFNSSGVHRRYSDDDLTRLLFLKFRIVRKHYGGFFLYPFTLAAGDFFQKHLHWEAGRFFNKVADFDNDISWGKWSFNVILLAEKI